MSRLMTLLLLLYALLPAQVAVGVSPMSVSNTAELLGKRVSKRLTLWSVVMKNLGTQPVLVMESAVLHAMGQQTPVAADRALLFVEGAARLSGWAIAGRLVEDSVVLATFFSTSGIVAVGEKTTIALSGFSAHAPYIVGRIRSGAVPAVQNYMKLAWLQPIEIGPKATGFAFIFTDKQQEPHYNSFWLDVPVATTAVLK